MTGARERFGFLVGVIVALLCVGSSGSGRSTAHPRMPRRSWPVPASRSAPRTRPSTTPSSRRSARNRARAPNERVEAYDEAREHGTAGQSGKLSLREGRALARPRAAAAPGSARSRSIPPPMTGSRPSRPIRAPRGCTSSRPATARPSRALATARSPWITLSISHDGGATFAAEQAAVRLQGLGPVRPDHRGRARHRRGLRAVHERLQRPVHEVHRPRRDLVGTGQDVRLRVVERQADHRRQRQRPGRLRRVQRPDRRRPVAGPVAQRGLDMDAGQARRLEPLRLRLRWGRRAGWHRLLRRVSHPVRRWRQQGHDAHRHDRRARLHLARPGRALDRQGRRADPARVWPARPPAARRTSISATTPSPPTPTATSCSCTTGRRRPAASSRSTPHARPTVGRPGRRRPSSRRPARKRPCR